MEESNQTQGSITRLLDRLRVGESQAMAPLLELIYPELHRIAAKCMRSEQHSLTLQPTALVNEAYLRLAGQQPDWRNRGHFLAIAALHMRRILVEHARRRLAQRRGAGVRAETLPDVLFAGGALTPEDLMAIDQALEQLATLDARQAQVVELRYFGGLDEKEVAEVLGISGITAKRDWRSAKAWLRQRMSAEAGA